MGLGNIILIIPFCRRVEEGQRVLDAMEKYSLKRGGNGLKIYAMCEILNNVILVDYFCKLFDGRITYNNEDRFYESKSRFCIKNHTNCQ